MSLVVVREHARMLVDQTKPYRLRPAMRSGIIVAKYNIVDLPRQMAFPVEVHQQI